MRASRPDARTLGCFAAALAVLTALPAAAQVPIQGLPQQSQKQVITQTIGITEITLVYHRPVVNGREIWGALVPYGAVWRAGANENTTISFTHPVRIEGEEVPAGTYGLHMLPGEDDWQVMLSSNSTSWGSFSYDEAEDVARVTVSPEKAPFQEVLTYSFEHISADGGVIALHWEELRVPIEFEVDTHEHVLAKIRNDLRSLPGFSWIGYQNAANYCLRHSINQEEAMEWADRALSMEENFQTLRTKAGLLMHAGETEEAMAIGDKLLDYANEAQTNMLGYQAMGRGDLDKAIEIFEKNTRDYPESWNVWDSLGEGQAAKGMTAEAIANYTKAREMAPEAQHARIDSVLEGLKEQ